MFCFKLGFVISYERLNTVYVRQIGLILHVDYIGDQLNDSTYDAGSIKCNF